MKKSAIILLGLLALMTGCQREKSVPEDSLPGFDVTLESIVSDSETKTFADEQHLVLWHNDDRVSVFEKKEYWEEYKYTGRTGTTGGRLIKVTSEGSGTGGDLDYYYAVYPHSELNGFDNNGHLLLTLPNVQPYDEFSFGRGSNLMVAASEDNNFRFKNVGGYLVFKLYGEGVSVSSIRLTGNKGEEISGDIDVVISPGVNPVVKMSTARYAVKYNEVELVCDTPVALSATAADYKEFWFVLPPMTFESGFSIEVTTSDGDVWTKTTNKAWTITRNHYTPVSAMEVVVEQTQSNNVIYYTSTDEQIVTPSKSDVFGANIISNKYVNGKGVISFDGDVTKIGTDAFFNCSRLTQIFLPESVTSIGNYAFERCTNLTSIKIPDNVENIGSGAFGYCTNLMRFEGKFASEDGKLLIIPDNYYGSVLRAFADPQATSVNISEDGISVGYVDMYVFAGHQNLKSVYCTCDYSSCAFNDSSVENFTLSYWSIDPLEFSEYNCKTLTLLDNDNNQYLSLGWPRYLESITLPEDITIFGDFGPNGSSLPTGCKIYGSHASIDHTCWIVDGDLQLFAFPEDTHFYKLPSSITKVSCIISSHKEDEGPLNYFYLNYETGDDISLSTQIGVVIPDSVSSILSPYCMRIPVFMESSTPPGVNEPIFGNTGMEFPIAIVVPYNSCDDYMNSWNAYPDNPDSWTPIFIFTYSELPNNSDTYFSDTIRTY